MKPLQKGPEPSCVFINNYSLAIGLPLPLP